MSFVYSVHTKSILSKLVNDSIIYSFTSKIDYRHRSDGIGDTTFKNIKEMIKYFTKKLKNLMKIHYIFINNYIKFGTKDEPINIGESKDNGILPTPVCSDELYDIMSEFKYIFPIVSAMNLDSIDKIESMIKNTWILLCV